MEAQGSRFLALIDTKDCETEENQEIDITLNGNRGSPTKKSDFDPKGIKANKARPAYGNHHVAKKSILKENINASIK